MAVGLALLVGCGSEEASSTTEGGLAEAPATQSPTDGVVTASGADFDFADTEGRDVLFWFWAPW